MSRSKMRIFAVGLAAAGAAAAGLLVGGHDLRRAPRLEAAESAALANDDGSVRVGAPGTEVTVDRERGKVSVTAPRTDVQVDPDAGRVTVRAPYVNLDIRW